jgi:hypothetical protein
MERTAEGEPAKDSEANGETRSRLFGDVRWETAAVLLFSMALAVALYRHAWRHPNSVHVGGVGDADEYTWFISWVPYALGHGLNPLLSSYVNLAGPGGGVNLMWNTSVLLPSLLVSPITVTAGSLVSYNLLITAAPALSTAAAYLAFRRWSSALPAVVGALVFGFSPSVTSQSIGHLAQVMLMSAPLALILFDRLLVRQMSRPWREGLALGLVAWAQLLTGEEVLAMEAVAAAIAVVVLVVVNARGPLRSHLSYAAKGLGVAAVSFATLAAPFLAEQYAGPHRVQDVHPVNVYVSDLLNFVSPTSTTQLAPRAAQHLAAHFTGNASEDGAYIGIPLLLLIVIALVVARRRQVVWIGASVAVSMVLLSMGPTLHVDGDVTSFSLPDKYLQRLPFFHNLLPDRFTTMMFLGVGMLVALGLNELAHGRSSLNVVGWGLALLGLAAICPVVRYPAFPSPPLPAFTTGWVCPAHATSMPAQALVLPAVDEMVLRWQAEADFCFTMPSATGMTGTNAGDLGPQPMLLTIGRAGRRLPALTPTVRAEAAGEIVRLGVTEIIVAPRSPAVPNMSATEQSLLVAWVTALLGQGPAQSSGTSQSGETFVWAHLPSPSSITAGT